MADQVPALREELEQLRQRMDAGQHQQDFVRDLAQAIQPRANLKPPKFTGREDAREFLETFDTVRVANGWDNATAVLRLKLSLEGAAKAGVAGNTYQQVRESLLKKYELTQDEARSALRTLRLRSGDSVHELGENVQRLVTLAHPNLYGDQRTEEAILYMVDAVGDRYLKHEFRL